jgi:hypothetical protein
MQFPIRMHVYKGHRAMGGWEHICNVQANNQNSSNSEGRPILSTKVSSIKT